MTPIEPGIFWVLRHGSQYIYIYFFFKKGGDMSANKQSNFSEVVHLK